MALNDARVGQLSLERAPHYGNGIPRVGVKVVKTLLCKVSEDLVAIWVEERTQTLIGMAVTSVQTVAFGPNSCCHFNESSGSSFLPVPSNG